MNAQCTAARSVYRTVIQCSRHSHALVSVSSISCQQ